MFGLIGAFIAFILFVLIGYALSTLVSEEEERQRVQAKRNASLEEKRRKEYWNKEKLKHQNKNTSEAELKKALEEEKEEQTQYDLPNSAFGITKDFPISRLSAKQIDLHFAQHEIVPPKPHSALDKYYADVWEDNNQLMRIYGISRIFNLADNENHQEEMTDLFLCLKKQLQTKYGPDDHDDEVTALYFMDWMRTNPKGIKKDTPLYEYIYNKVKTKYTNLFGENGFNPLMLKQITPAHVGFSAKWNFSDGDIESIQIGCRRFENLINGFIMTAEKKFPGAGRIFWKQTKNLELTFDEKKLVKNAIEYMRKKERLFGNSCVYVQYSFRFSNEERSQRADKILRKSIVDKIGNSGDWNAL